VGDGSQARCDRFDGTTWTYSISPQYDLGYLENRTYLRTKDGPALCARTGEQSAQTITCSVLKSSGWMSVSSPAGDWGYTDRAWLTNDDGTVSYCRRVGNGGLERCDRFNGTAWTYSISPQYDLGYPENRTYLSTKDGPATCARAGDQYSQALVCSVPKSTGWVSVASPAGDWGYDTDRAWITNSDGTASYCRRVGNGGLERCDRFNGTTWTYSISPQYDLGYPDTF
jgi:hypothetical protein